MPDKPLCLIMLLDMGDGVPNNRAFNPVVGIRADNFK